MNDRTEPFSLSIQVRTYHPKASEGAPFFMSWFKK
jgi:hypothetical protein